jgi:hypothetical protein
LGRRQLLPLPLWRWKLGSNVAGGDRVGDIHLGQQYLTPHDDECTGYAWAPACSATCLFRALNGDLDDDEDIVCTVHGANDGDDQEDDSEGRADLEVQAIEAISG